MLATLMDLITVIMVGEDLAREGIFIHATPMTMTTTSYDSERNPAFKLDALQVTVIVSFW